MTDDVQVTDGRRRGHAELRVVPGDVPDDLPVDLPRSRTTRRLPGKRGEAGKRDGSGPIRIAVVGGGIAGLAAAWQLVADRGPDVAVTLIEADREVGGKLRASDVGGIPLDEGAESMLAARPEGAVLARAVGLGDDIVHPAQAQASVLARGRLRPMPPGMISGIPTDLRSLAASGIISLPGLLRIPLDHWLPRTTIAQDVSVGDYVATRIGPEVVEKLVEPMLGGVYAGRAEDLSLEMTLPALARLFRRERSLLAATREARATGASSAGARRGPAFASIDGGLGRLPGAVVERLAQVGASIMTGATATGLRATERGWRISIAGDGSASSAPGHLDADGVILAVPAPAAARLLRRANPHSAAVLDTIEYASVALVTMLHPADGVPPGLAGSGFLVPVSEGRMLKAVTFTSRKWPWVARRAAAGGGDGVAVFRASVGRFGDVAALQLDDDELVAVVGRELNEIAGLPAVPLVARVTRWSSGLPQYAVGHRLRVARVRELLAASPTIAVCGAAYDGVGVPACIGSGQFAASQVLAGVRERDMWAGSAGTL